MSGYLRPTLSEAPGLKLSRFSIHRPILLGKSTFFVDKVDLVGISLSFVSQNSWNLRSYDFMNF